MRSGDESDFTIDTDQSRFQLDAIHRFLSVHGATRSVCICRVQVNPNAPSFTLSLVGGPL